MKIGEKVEKMESELMDLRSRIQTIEFALSEVKRELRGEMAENIISAYLNSLGMRIKPPEKTCQDRIAVDPSTKNRVPVQIKSVSLKRHGWEIRVDDVPLKEFTGFYIILLEHKPEDIILHIESGELRRLMSEFPKTKDGYHHKDRHALYVPASLEGFERYLSPDKLKAAVFGNDRRGGN